MNNKREIKLSTIKCFVGIALILFSLINVVYIAQSLAIVTVSLFGGIGYWFINPLFIAAGIYLIIKRNKPLSLKRNIYLISLAILTFALLLIATVFVYYPNLPDFADPKITLSASTIFEYYARSWWKAMVVFKGTNYIHYNALSTCLGGGVIGYVFTGLLNTIISEIGTIISGFVILVTALIIMFHKPLKNGFNKLFSVIKLKRQNKKAMVVQEKTLEPSEGASPDITASAEPIDADRYLNDEGKTDLKLANLYSSDELPPEETPENFEEGAKPAMLSDEETAVAAPLAPYEKPSYDLLATYEVSDVITKNEEQSKINTEIINRTFQDLKIGAKTISHTIGPRVTRYDIQMDVNASIRSIPQFVLDISQRLGGVTARFEPIVTGKMTSGLEVPNAESTTISFKEIVSVLPPASKSPLAIPFGKNISGEIKTADLASFPHMLIAGATGSGKSVLVHSIIMSIIMRNTPEDVRLLLIDPKRVEFAKYHDLPFLLCPTITEPKKAQIALQKLCEEMDRRYDLFAQVMVNQIKPYNAMMKANGKAILPYIVVVVDEFADLISANKKIDVDINRIAAKARAAGIHLIIATQRPSVDVITGTIKANLPVRVALRVPDQESSKTILGGQGAEGLLGNGDMLVSCPQIQSSGNFRCQGCYISDEEIAKVVKFINDQRKPQYDVRFMDLEDHQIEAPDATPKITAAEARAQSDEQLYQYIKEQVYKREYTSISTIERENGIGFTRAGRMFKRLQDEGLVSRDSEASKGSKVLKEKFNIKESATTAGSAEVTSTKPNPGE
ncbi:MAG: DUF87 domain-containing protein [Bacilli bacterium]|nr:DUF87 domain-containing protein [Bacilli bacterium]